MKQHLCLAALLLGGVWGLTSCAGKSEFSRADLNNDDRVTTEEIEDRLVEAIFEKEDHNNDGRVTAAEWGQVNPNSSADLYAVRDTNGDKVVDLKEFQDYADSSGMFDRALAQLDPNHDGFVSPVEAEKILAASGN